MSITIANVAPVSAVKDRAKVREFLQRREFLRFPVLVRAALGRALGVGISTPIQRQLEVARTVTEIIADVLKNQDEALLEWTEKLDNVSLKVPEQIRVSDEKISQTFAKVSEDFLALARRAVANIKAYQESIKVAAQPALRRGDRELAVRYVPVDRVGVYVPGGRAFYPSTVLMTVVPAQVAGVKEIAIASPPTSNGDVNPMVLALARELGVREIYRIGGAQAIAALACGTFKIPRVDMIVGPGNAYVAEAKRQVSGRVRIDSIAGPSEVLIVADDSARPDWIAADMLAQAEHDPGSAVLVTESETLAKLVAVSIDEQVPSLDRRDAIRKAIDEASLIIVTAKWGQTCGVADDYAAEHLQIIVRPEDEQKVLAKIRHAGAIFVGPYTPVPLGDYYAGPSHVLPTGGTARFFSGLSCNDFLKASSVIRYGKAALNEDADDVIDFATREGLTAHAHAVRMRKET